MLTWQEQVKARIWVAAFFALPVVFTVLGLVG